MSDDGELLPVGDDFGDYHACTGTWIKEKRALLIRLNVTVLVIACGLLAAVILQAVAIAVLFPMKQLVPFIVAMNSDGSHDVLTHIDEFSIEERRAAVKAVLWEYVVKREEYIFTGAPQRYYAVSDLSSPSVMAAYQHWFRDDPKSPEKQYEARQIDSILVEHITGGVQFTSNQSADVVFWRHVQLPGGESAPRERWRASIGFSLHNKIQERYADTDFIGLQIVEYQSRCDNCEIH